MGRRINKFSLDPELEEVFKQYFAGKIRERCGNLKEASLSLFYRHVKPNYPREYPALRVTCGRTKFVIHIAQEVMDKVSYLRIAYRLRKLTEQLSLVYRKLQSLKLSLSEETALEAVKFLATYKNLEEEIKRVKKLVKEAYENDILTHRMRKEEIEKVLK